MRRAKQKSSIKGKGKKLAEPPPDDLKYALEKVIMINTFTKLIVNEQLATIGDTII